MSEKTMQEQALEQAAQDQAELSAETVAADRTFDRGAAAPADADPAKETLEQNTSAPETTGPQPDAPVYAAPRRAKNPGRGWGVCIGIALGALSLACIVLTLGLVRAITGGMPPAAGPSQSQTPQQPTPPQTDTRLDVYDIPADDGAYTTQYVVKQVKDSVVGILTYDGTGIDPAGSGTGIIMSEDGYIITNAHVVVDATGLTVVLHDESKYTAIVLGYDEKTDLAVIKIKAEGLTPAEFGNSDQVVVGERAIAIGNPGGLSGSVSQGIISGKNREITITLSDGTVATLTALQTDAAINPGNSGGPLLNAWGQVIGINSSKIVKNGYEGIGFAIPVNEAKPIIDNLIQYGYVKDRAVLGISVIALDASNGPANGLPSQGLYIASVAEYSDLARHGIMPGDVILKANGVEMVSTDDLAAQLAMFRPGDSFEMEILRSYDNTVVTIQVLLLDSRAGS